MGGLLALILWAAPALAQSDGDAERGEVLAGLAGCPACHTAEDGPVYAGGHVLDTRWGTFVGSNITPDPDHGIGGWNEEQLAMMRAISKARKRIDTEFTPDGSNVGMNIGKAAGQKVGQVENLNLFSRLVAGADVAKIVEFASLGRPAAR